MAMADEYFFALTLKGKNSEVWDPEAKGAEDYQGGHKLIIKQALLGPDANKGETNVVQVEAVTWKDCVKIPIATLKAGVNNQVLLDLSFPDPPVTFSLIEGNGPVHIIGHHLIGSPIFDEMDEMEEEMIDDEEGEEGAEEGNRKRKISNGKSKEEEDEDEEPKTKKAKTAAAANNTKGKTPVKNNLKAKK